MQHFFIMKKKKIKFILKLNIQGLKYFYLLCIKKQGELFTEICDIFDNIDEEKNRMEYFNAALAN